MKKNITINMFGTLYAIDEDACNLLQEYLDSMKRYFQTRPGGDEIADDIEHHVAELLWAKKEQGIEAISIGDVRDIITQIGDARQIDTTDDEESQKDETNGDKDETQREKTVDAPEGEEEPIFQRMKTNMTQRRLFRHPNDKLVGGVLAGVATYTGSGSPLVWRLLYIILLLLSFSSVLELLFLPLLIGYCIMWAIVPQPLTPEDRLRMKGIEVTPENIHQQILEDSEVKNAQTPVPQNNNGCLSIFLKVCLVFLMLPVLVIGGTMIFLFFVSITAMLGVGTAFFPLIFDGKYLGVADLIQDNWLLYLLGIVAWRMVVALPVYGFVRFIRHHNNPERKTHGWQILVAWIVSLALGIAALTSFLMNVNEIERDYRDNQRHGRASISIPNINIPAVNIDINQEADSFLTVPDSLNESSDSLSQQIDTLNINIKVKKK